MRLRTIWTMPAMALNERLNRTGEAIVMAIAHRLPRRLAYWSYIDTGVRVIKSNEAPYDVSYVDVLQRITR